jgi:acyl-coenzyme A synthetase/AMP-(fatty) acid ligase
MSPLSVCRILVPGPAFDAAALGAWLAGKLGPRYPFRIVNVATIPVTTAGKIDRTGLSAHVQALAVTTSESLFQKEES